MPDTARDIFCANLAVSAINSHRDDIALLHLEVVADEGPSSHAAVRMLNQLEKLEQYHKDMLTLRESFLFPGKIHQCVINYCVEADGLIGTLHSISKQALESVSGNKSAWKLRLEMWAFPERHQELRRPLRDTCPSLKEHLGEFLKESERLSEIGAAEFDIDTPLSKS